MGGEERRRLFGMQTDVGIPEVKRDARGAGARDESVLAATTNRHFDH